MCSHRITARACAQSKGTPFSEHTHTHTQTHTHTHIHTPQAGASHPHSGSRQQTHSHTLTLTHTHTYTHTLKLKPTSCAPTGSQRVHVHSLKAPPSQNTHTASRSITPTQRKQTTSHMQGPGGANMLGAGALSTGGDGLGRSHRRSATAAGKSE